MNITMGYWELPPEYIRLIKSNFNDYNKLHHSTQTSGISLDAYHYKSDLLRRFRNGTVPDFFYSYSDLNTRLTWNGLTSVLEEYVPDSAKFKEEILSKPYLKSMLSSDGKLLAMPYYGAHTAFIYNESHVEKSSYSNPPRDWNELESQALKIKEKGICEFPILVPLHGDGSVETLYSLILGFNPPAENYLFDENGNALFDEQNSPLFKVMKWLLDGIYVKKIVSRKTILLDVIPASAAMKKGKFSFIWLPWYLLSHMNYPHGRKSSKIRQAINPGYGYTSCYTRTYTASKRSLDDPKKADELWKVLQYFGGKTDDQLEPDFKRGTYKVAKKLATELGVPSPLKDLWDDAEYCAALDRWGSIETFKKQDKQVFNSLNDPRSTPWLADWDGEWGSAPLRNAVHKILRKDTTKGELLSCLCELAVKWRELRRKYETA